MSRLQNWLVAASLAAAPLTSLAVHPNNAGPKDVELKFKLPTPAPLSPKEALKSFKLPAGFKIELVASEPEIQAPVAISFDDQGRMYVVEMRGYMRDIEGAGEEAALGRVTLLEDADGDGFFEKHTVFVDKLVMPRAVMAVAGGALVSEPPNLRFYQDTNEDGIADEKKLIATDYATRGGQPEHMANTPLWAMDNWIYSAAYRTRFRYEQGKWVSSPTTARGQWGLTTDDYGRLYYNFNSDFLRGDLVPAHYYSRNPNSTGSYGVGVKVMKDQTVWPSHPTPGVNRGYDGSLRDDGTLRECTATCGPGIYRGDLFPREFYGNCFIPEPSANLVKRVVLKETDGMVTGENAYQKSEFLTSTDERFRPVTAQMGPDGALYLVDMYRGVLQHKSFLTHYLIANIKQRNLEQPFDQGRIYRIVPVGAQPRIRKLPAAPAELVKFLADPNGERRDTAQRLLVEKHDDSVQSALETMAASHANPLARIHALWTLEGLGVLDPSVVASALGDKNAKVRVAATRLADSQLVPGPRSIVLPRLIKLLDDPSAEVQQQLAFTLSAVNDEAAENAVVQIVKRNPQNDGRREALLSGLRSRELEILERLLGAEQGSVNAAFGAFAQAVMKEGRSKRIERLVHVVASATTPVDRKEALLRGMVATAKPGTKAPAQAVSKVKLIYLEKEPQDLQELERAPAAKLRPLLASLDQRLAWPGKPGVPPPPVIVPLTASEQALFEKGKGLYQTVCIACHQPDGLGQEGLAPPLVDSEWVLGSPKRLARIVMHGLSGPISVKGLPYRLDMPGLPEFKDEDIAAALTYIRREWDHSATAVTPEVVGAVRQGSKERTSAWSAQELLKVD